jgi:type I restriction enzyme M protein
MGLILPLSILNNETSVYVAARRVLLVGFCVVGLVELRDKTFKPTNTTTVAVFAKKRAKSDIKDAAAQALRLVSSKSKQSLVEMSKKLDISPVNLAAAIKHDEKEFRAIEQKGTIEAVLKLSPDSFGALRHLLYAQARVLIGYSGEKKDQEHFLGYRFSKSRGQEGVEILRGASEQIDSRLYDPENPSNPEKVSFYLRNAFAGTPKVVDASLKHCLKEVPIDELLPHSREIVISNPSKFFTSRHLSLGSISPLGDFIDEYAQREISLAALRDSKELYYTSGLTYAKRTSEVPYVTEKRVLTASNIDIDTGRLDLEKKLIYLRNEFALPEDVQPQQNDIIISNASGSLKHLGKVAWVAEALPNYAVGGFLGILRFKDPQLGKAVYYRLMSARFRGHVAGLRGQNINNLDIDKVDSCRITVPKELAKFAAEAIKRERAG